MTDHVYFENSENSPARRKQQADLSRSIWADPDFERILLDIAGRRCSPAAEPAHLVMVGIPGFTPVGFAMVGLATGSSQYRPEPEMTSSTSMPFGPPGNSGHQCTSPEARNTGVKQVDEVE